MGCIPVIAPKTEYPSNNQPTIQMAQALSEILQTMRASHGVNCELNKLAEQYAFSPRYLAKLFKSRTGQTWQTYKTKIKMDHAKSLISQTRMSIDAVSSALGYENKSSFIRTFRQVTGQNPSRFRYRKTAHPGSPADRRVKTPSDSISTLCKTTTPEMAAYDRQVHPTHLVRMMAMTAYQSSVRHAELEQGYSLTVEIHSLHLSESVQVGDQIRTQGRVIRVGRTSSLIEVTAHTVNPVTHQDRQIGLGYFTNVSTTTEFQPIPVPFGISELDYPVSVQQSFPQANSDEIHHWLQINANKQYHRTPEETKIVEQDFFLPAMGLDHRIVHTAEIVGWLLNISYTCIRRFTRSAAVALVAVTQLRFNRPVLIHDFGIAVAKVVFVGSRSVDIQVSLYTGKENTLNTPEHDLINQTPTSEGFMTFVVVDDQRNPLEIETGLTFTLPSEQESFQLGVCRKLTYLRALK